MSARKTALLAACLAAISVLRAEGLLRRIVEPVSAVTNSSGRVVYDFGRESFGWAEARGRGEAEIRMGELLGDDGGVEMNPGGTIRAASAKLVLDGNFRRVPLTPDKRNTTGGAEGAAIRLPEKFGTVMPIRFVETPIGAEVRLVAVEWPMDRTASAFSCDDPALERVYGFCKHSIIATSFAGMYVDGDRERIPYESDAYINQLGEYAVHAGPSLARKSHEYLMDHPTWPTEWRQHSIKMAWADWMRTGETNSLVRCYERLKSEKLLLGHVREDGIVLSGGERRRNGKPNSRGLADIVDWPPCERDGFVFCDANAVVNAFHHSNLMEMADIAAAIGRTDDALDFRARAERLRSSFNRVFFDPSRGVYVDGEGTDHASLHANAAALAFGLVPPSAIDGVADFCISRGMACSPYFAQYLLEGLFNAGRADAAIDLMTASGDRGWLGMMDFGATVAMEAWSLDVKPNLDMNHAWSTAPLNIISRRLLGVEPMEPGFAKIRVAPMPGRLRRVEGKVPTPRGPVYVKIDGGRIEVDSPVPATVEFGR